MVFPGDTPDSDSAICFPNSDLRRLLHYRLEVLEAALLRLAELRGEAANALESCDELVQRKLAPQSTIKKYIQPLEIRGCQCYQNGAVVRAASNCSNRLMNSE